MTEPLHIVLQGQEVRKLLVDVDKELHERRDGDFMFLRRMFDKHGDTLFSISDSPLLRSIAKQLMTDEYAGVSMLEVRKHSLDIYYSAAVSEDHVKDVIRRACSEAGYMVIDHWREAAPSRGGMQVSELDHPMAVVEVLTASFARHNAEQASSSQA